MNGICAAWSVFKRTPPSVQDLPSLVARFPFFKPSDFTAGESVRSVDVSDKDQTAAKAMWDIRANRKILISRANLRKTIAPNFLRHCRRCTNALPSETVKPSVSVVRVFGTHGGLN